MSKAAQYDLSITVDGLELYIFLVSDKKQSLPEKEPSDYPLHTHRFFELFLCRQGTTYIRTEEKTLPVHQGEALLIPPGFKHQMQCSSSDADRLSICFSFHKANNGEGRLYHEFQQYFVPNTPLLFSSVPSLKVRIDLLMRAVADNHLRFFALELIAFLSYLIDRDTIELSIFKNAQATDDARIVRLEHLINVGYPQNLTAKEVAEKLYICQRQLNRIAIRCYGVSFRRALINRRLQAAKEHLESSSLPIYAIREAVGFKSDSSFLRAFTARYGMTPREYRSQFKA